MPVRCLWHLIPPGQPISIHMADPYSDIVTFRDPQSSKVLDLTTTKDIQTRWDASFFSINATSLPWKPSLGWSLSAAHGRIEVTCPYSSPSWQDTSGAWYFYRNVDWYQWFGEIKDAITAMLPESAYAASPLSSVTVRSWVWAVESGVRCVDWLVGWKWLHH